MAPQNWRALDLLTAEKRGTCQFLREDWFFFFFINASGIVQNKVRELRESIRLRPSWAVPTFPDGGSHLGQNGFSGFSGALAALLLILSIGPCIFQILLRRVRELTQTATGQMLVVATYSKLPSRDPEAP